MPGHTGAHEGSGYGPIGSGRPRGPGQDGSNRPSVQNRPSMLDIAGPVAGPVAGTTTSPNQGSDNQMGIVNPAVMDLALTPSLNIFNQGAGGIEMSTAAVAAAPETIPEETNPLINFFNKRIVNPYVDAVYNYGLPLSQFTPTQFGLISLYGNMFNFNPTKDEETGEISTSNLGEVGTATFGKLNLDNYIGAKEVEGGTNCFCGPSPPNSILSIKFCSRSIPGFKLKPSSSVNFSSFSKFVPSKFPSSSKSNAAP